MYFSEIYAHGKLIDKCKHTTFEEAVEHLYDELDGHYKSSFCLQDYSQELERLAELQFENPDEKDQKVSINCGFFRLAVTNE